MPNIHVEQFAPRGKFDLLHQNQYFTSWPLLSDQKTLVMAFPVEGWSSTAAVTISQNADTTVSFTVFGTKEIEPAINQAKAALSLDVDGRDWDQVGMRDPIFKELQETYKYMRPSLFHTPYEAAAHFLIGHRISMQQSRKIRQRLAEDFGESFSINDQTFYSFPSPQVLLTINEYPGLSDIKIGRLHAAAQAALDGWLEREHLRNLGEEAALTKIESLPGVGPFFSQGILNRGAGLSDGFTHDDLTYHAIRERYYLGDDASPETISRIAEQWRPFRMWAVVLHHVWLRQSGNMPKRTFAKR